MDILVLSPCSRSKRYDPVIDCETVDSDSREELVRRYRDSVTSAAEMYTGREHQHIREAVAELRECASVDWYIISAGFGLLREDTVVPSYECGFSDIESVRPRAARAGHDVDSLTNNETIQAVGCEKGIPQKFRKTLNRGYDILFVVLSEPYLLSVANALTDIPAGTTAYAFASNGSKQYIGDCQWIPATETERQLLETTWMELRGRQLRTIASIVGVQELEEFGNDPQRAHSLSSWIE